MGGVLAFVNIHDQEKWLRYGRQDIIDIIKELNPVWAGDHYFSGRTGERINECPFLKKENGYRVCSIYEFRPEVCIRFMPGMSMICPQYGKV